MARALKIVLVISTIVIALWFYRSNSFACGYFDTQGKCMSSVALDIAPLDIQNPRRSSASYTHQFDVSSTADKVLVTITGDKKLAGATELYSALVLFDAKTGKVLNILQELSGNKVFHEIAISKDSSLVASSILNSDEQGITHSVVVQNVEGEILQTVVHTVTDDEGEADRPLECSQLFDFSDDNKFLQCGLEVFNLETGSVEFKTDFPSIDGIADSSNYDFASSKHGLRTDWLFGYPSDNTSLDLVLRFPEERRVYKRSAAFERANKHLSFSPDGNSFLEMQIVPSNTQTIQEFVRNNFKGLFPQSRFVVWDIEGDAGTPIWSVSKATRYAWANDSQSFAVLDEDLSLSVFKAN